METQSYVSLAKAKNILKKMSNEREELSYGQRIAVEHAEKFARLSIKDTDNMIKELTKLERIEETHAYKIADILPQTKDDVKALFAKERITLNETIIQSIVDIVKKYYTI